MQRVSVVAVIACGLMAVSAAGVALVTSHERRADVRSRISEMVDVDDLDADALSINGRTYRLG